jgi:hypothetical protein
MLVRRSDGAVHNLAHRCRVNEVTDDYVTFHWWSERIIARSFNHHPLGSSYIWVWKSGSFELFLLNVQRQRQRQQQRQRQEQDAWHRVDTRRPVEVPSAGHVRSTLRRSR